MNATATTLASSARKSEPVMKGKAMTANFGAEANVPAIEFQNVTLMYGRDDKAKQALNDISFSIPANSITGLLGRNGAGKSSIMAIIAGLRQPTTGKVLVGGANPHENPELAKVIMLAYNRKIDGEEPFNTRQLLQLHAQLRPNWDEAYAQNLLEVFKVPTNSKPSRLSDGQRAALRTVVGLASRAPITMLDEVYLGMDTVYREVFVRELLADFMAHPRTILFSTHYINEMERLFGGVLIIDDGRVLLHKDADELRMGGSSLHDTFIKLTLSEGSLA
jgi:ABC-2 type transport system ATP-binding protein